MRSAAHKTVMYKSVMHSYGPFTPQVLIPPLGLHRKGPKCHGEARMLPADKNDAGRLLQFVCIIFGFCLIAKMMDLED